VLAAAAVTAASTIIPATAAHALPVCQTATGTTYDAYQNPLPGVRVSIPANGCSPTAATSDASGHFSLSVDVTAAAPTATATKTGYQSAQGAIAYSPAPGGAANGLTLPYDIQASASPAYVQPGHAVTYTVRTTAPPPPASDNYACTWGGDGDTTSPPPGYVHSAPGAGGTGSLAGVKAIGVGDAQTGDPFYTALLDDGSVVSWGEHAGGFRGDGQTQASWDANTSPVLGEGGVGTLTGITAIAVGDYYTLALRSDGHVDGWGTNLSGGLGATSGSFSLVPFRVLGPDGSPLSGVTAISTRGGHSLALLSTGEVVEWGALPPSATTTAHYLLDFDGSHFGANGDPVAMISAGLSFGVVVTHNGWISAWGDNRQGQLGNSTAGLGSATPVNVVGVTTSSVKALAAENDLTLALLTDGRVANWGANQLSTGTAQTGQATMVPGLPGAQSVDGSLLATAIGTGDKTAFAALPDTTLAVWGDNQYGEADPAAPNPIGSTRISPTRKVTATGAGWLAGVRSASGGQAATAVVRTAGCSSPLSASRIVDTSNSGVAFTQGTTDASGYTTWTATVTPSGADGARSLTVCAVDRSMPASSSPCTGRAPGVLTPPATLTYTVDGTPPDTAAGRIYPLSGGNVQAGVPQPLRIQTTDATSGIATNGVTFTLNDTTAGTSRTLTSVGRDGNWYRSANVTFLDGHLYTVSATVTDRAGNAVSVAQAPTSQGGGFLGMTIPNLTSTAPATTARSMVSSPSQGCSVSSVDTSTLTRTITCTNVTINFPAVPVQLSGSRHGGKATLTQTVGLANLHIHPTAAGTSLGQTDVVPFPSTTQSVAQSFRVDGPSFLPGTVTTQSATTTIAQVTATVGPAVDGATIDMPPTAATATTMACTTAPIGSWCSPDPVPPVVNDANTAVTDVVALPGGLVAARVQYSGAYIGSYGASLALTGTYTRLSDTSLIEDKDVALDAPDGSTSDIAQRQAWLEGIGGWTTQDETSILDQIDAGASLTGIARQAESRAATATTATDTPGVDPHCVIVPASDANYHGRGCYDRADGNSNASYKYMGDRSWASARANSSWQIDQLSTEHTYTGATIVQWDPSSQKTTDCGNGATTTVGVSGYGVSLSQTEPVCTTEMTPDLIGPHGNVADDFKTTWEGPWSTGTQFAEQTNVIQVAPPNTPSGFVYHWKAKAQQTCDVFCRFLLPF
jgi:alpha-tubulin suppressor-like RCC1 family protein